MFGWGTGFDQDSPTGHWYCHTVVSFVLVAVQANAFEDDNIFLPGNVNFLGNCLNLAAKVAIL